MSNVYDQFNSGDSGGVLVAPPVNPYDQFHAQADTQKSESTGNPYEQFHASAPVSNIPELSAATGNNSEPNWLERSWHKITGGASELGADISGRATEAAKAMRENSLGANHEAGATTLPGLIGGAAAMLRPSPEEIKREQRTKESQLGPDFVQSLNASEQRKREIGDVSGAEQLFGSDKSPLQLPLWSPGQVVGKGGPIGIATPITKQDDNVEIPLGSSGGTVKLSTVKAVYQPFARVWNMLASPGGLMTAGLGSAVSTAKAGAEGIAATAATKPSEMAATGIFTKDMTGGAIQQVAELPKILADPDKTNAQKLSATADAAFSVGLSGLAVNHFSGQVREIAANPKLDNEQKIDIIAKIEAKSHDEIAQQIADAVEEKSKQLELDLSNPYRQFHSPEEQVAAMANTAPFGSAENPVKIAPGAEVAPAIPENHVPVKIERPDGTTYDAAMMGYQEVPTLDGGHEMKPNIGRAEDGSWSHGLLKEGEKIVGGNPPEDLWTRDDAGRLKLAEAKPLPENAIVTPIIHPVTGEIIDHQIDIPGEPGGPPRFPGSTEPFPKFSGSVADARDSGYEVAHLESQHVTNFSEEGMAAEPPERPNESTRPVILSGDESTHGIAARVSEQRAEGGHIAPIEPGEGISAEASVQHGRDLLEAGRDPKAAMDDFQKTGKTSSDDIALVRAHGEQLAKAANEAADKFGVDSPEYKAASKADSDWHQQIKPMQTEWHRQGQAMQGETEIDTGTFHGIARAVREATGHDLSEKQAKQAKEIAEGVKTANEETDSAKKKVLDALAEEQPKPEKKKGLGLSQSLSDAAKSARDRIRARLAEGRVQAGLDPTDLADHAIVGAEYIAKGLDKFADWSKEMVREFGDRITPFLKDIYGIAKTKAEEFRKSDFSVKDIWKRAKDYLESGEDDYDEIRHKIAEDTGLSVDEVTKKLTEPKAMREVTNDMYAKMAKRRALITNAKDWVNNQKTPGWLRFIKAVPRVFFADKVFGHGTVGMITHAGLNIFHPSAWATYWPEFFRQFKLLGLHDSGAYHERMMQDLVRDPNFITARRAGLANDPVRQTDDYQNVWMGKYLSKIGMQGTRGFDALKLFRQARFNQIWSSFPDSLKTADQAKLLADSINHATGVVQKRFGEWSNWTFFAPKLEGSRWAWMIGDPAKAAKILAGWKDATPAEQQFALREVKQKAAIAGTYLGLLAINQGLLSATNSGQKINFTNPRRGDFLAFKAAGHNLGIVGPMLGIVRLFANLLHAAAGQRGPVEKMQSRSEQMGTIGESYLRGKLSPFAGFAMDVASQSDFQGKPLPFSSDKVPAYLRRQGDKKYTYKEYLAQQFTPIPISEAIREVWRKQGMNESTAAHWIAALTTAAVAGGTGARMSKDTHEDQLPPPPESSEESTKQP